MALPNWVSDVTFYLRHFRPGRCVLCGRWTWFILKCENAHEECWLDTK